MFCFIQFIFNDFTFDFFKYTLLPYVSDVDKELGKDNMISVLKHQFKNAKLFRDIIGYFAFGTVGDFRSSIGDTISEEGWEGMDTVWSSLGASFSDAHAMSSYRSYLDVLSGDELLRKKESRYNVVNCPVDVFVYNKNSNRLVGQIIDNVVDEEILSHDDSIVMSVEGDEKSFWLPSDGDYEVKLIGNDTGTMDYTIREIDPVTGETKRKNFFDVPLTDGLTLTGIISGDDFVLEDYVLEYENGERLQGDEIVESDDLRQVEVTTQIDGNGYVDGSGIYTSGDYATLSATELDSEYIFAGWYLDDVLVSEEAEYRCRVTEDITFVAKFVQSEHNYQPTSTTEPTCTEPGSVTYTCACGDSYTEPINALGHDWSDWSASGDHHIRSCKRSGCNETESKLHTWNNGVVTMEATCKETGTRKYTCTTCNATKTETITKNAANHASYGTALKNKVDANCTAKGYTGDTVCNGCETVITKGHETASLGHTEPDGNGNCTRCGAHLKDVDPGNKPADNSKPAGDCKYCGQDHTGLFGWLIKFFHSILALFGLRK